jgi:hypothetical protein
VVDNDDFIAKNFRANKTRVLQLCNTHVLFFSKTRVLQKKDTCLTNM